MIKYTVPFQDFIIDSKQRGDEYHQALQRVLDSGWYILGPELEAFEQEFAEYLGVKHVIGVGNGLEAIQIALMCLGIGTGDEVITTPLSAIATTLAILAVQATPVFVDSDQNGLINPDLIESAITKRTKAILPVHLYGNVVDLNKISTICTKHKLILIEDAAQAHGAEFDGKKVGSFGEFGCFSFYPTKNLGALGDAGALVTNNDTLAELAKKIRNYGQTSKYVHTHYSINSRLDEVQAAFLRIKLKYLVSDTKKRQKLASLYDQLLHNSNVKPLSLTANSNSSRHLYVVKSSNRVSLNDHLAKHGVEALVHYPRLIPDQPLFKDEYQSLNLQTGRHFVNEIISLPLHPGLEQSTVENISAVINNYKI